MRFAASLFDTLSQFISPPNYMPMRQNPDNDDDIELRPLTSDDSPRASNRTASRGSPFRPRDAGAVQRRTVLQVPPTSATNLNAAEPTDHLLQWLQQSIPSAFAKNKESGPRSIVVGKPDASFARNVTRNQKYPATAPPPRCVAVSLCRCSMSLTRYQVPRRYFPPSSHRRAV